MGQIPTVEVTINGSKALVNEHQQIAYFDSGATPHGSYCPGIDVPIHRNIDKPDHVANRAKPESGHPRAKAAAEALGKYWKRRAAVYNTHLRAEELAHEVRPWRENFNRAMTLAKLDGDPSAPRAPEKLLAKETELKKLRDIVAEGLGAASAALIEEAKVQRDSAEEELGDVVRAQQAFADQKANELRAIAAALVVAVGVTEAREIFEAALAAAPTVKGIKEQANEARSALSGDVSETPVRILQALEKYEMPGGNLKLAD